VFELSVSGIKLINKNNNNKEREKRVGMNNVPKQALE
jgi:hypothetical protein